MASPGWVVPTEPLVELAVLPVVASVPVLVNVEAELVAADALPVAAVIPTGIAIKEKRAARMAATLPHRPLGRACKGRRARPRSRRGDQHLKRVPPTSAMQIPLPALLRRAASGGSVTKRRFFVTAPSASVEVFKVFSPPNSPP